MSRFEELDGLRGYLALWVAFGHAWQLTAWNGELMLFQFLNRNASAVDVFMILSGFVIFHLLLSAGDETYLAYITRRFFRLFPTMALLCFAGWTTYGYLVEYVQTVGWTNLPVESWQTVKANFVSRSAAVEEDLPAHILAHATMMHGVIPDEVLPEASRTFLGPAWSVSLEWQFYLLAPLFLLAIRRPAGAFILGLALVGGSLVTSSKLLGTFEAKAFFPEAAPYFAVGIGSRLAMPELRRLDWNPLLAVPLAGTTVFTLSHWNYALTIWACVYPIVVGRRTMLSLVFANPVTLLLGRISYSIYLAHFVVLSLAGWGAVRVWPDIAQPAMLAVLFGAVAMTLPLSLVLYRAVERPGIALGQWLATRKSDTALGDASPGEGGIAPRAIRGGIG